MENIWHQIQPEQIEKDQFLLIEYWQAGRNFILAKAVNKKRINELAESDFNKVRLNEVARYFTLRDFTLSRKLIKKGKDLIWEDGNTTPATISKIFVLEKEFLQKMAQGTIKQKEEKTDRAQKEEEKFRETMEKIGLLEIQKKEVEKK